MNKKTILIFGVGSLQKSLIERCKLKGLFTIGIDPDENASCKDIVDAFEIVNGQDFEGTLFVAKKYNISGIITAATDKPLVMMARIAEVLNLPFFSVETAEWSTDKLLMKQKFQGNNIPCAKGFLLNSSGELANLKVNYPVIVKPRDNSGSRGVIYCINEEELKNAVKEALQFTEKGNVLVEEYIGGKEYSIESLHSNGKTYVIQITEKITTEFPYNVELGHIQPAKLSESSQRKIKILIEEVAKVLKFENCGSHTELKISTNGIRIIETSPRLGGDFISSTLVPISTGINMEDILIDISIGKKLKDDFYIPQYSKCSGVKYFVLPEGKIASLHNIDRLSRIEGIKTFYFNLKEGDIVNKITSSLNRYGFAIFESDNRQQLLSAMDYCKNVLDIEIKFS